MHENRAHMGLFQSFLSWLLIFCDRENIRRCFIEQDLGYIYHSWHDNRERYQLFKLDYLGGESAMNSFLHVLTL